MLNHCHQSYSLFLLCCDTHQSYYLNLGRYVHRYFPNCLFGTCLSHLSFQFICFFSFYFLSILSLLHIGLFPVMSCCSSIPRYFPQLCPINAHRSLVNIPTPIIPQLFHSVELHVYVDFPEFPHLRPHVCEGSPYGERPAAAAQRGPTSPNAGVIRSTLI